MPAFSIGGTVVASYAAFSEQATKTGITFSPRKPIPDELVERLVMASREDAGV